MINPKDLENLEFDKSFMGGYNVESVDEFIYNLNLDYEALFEENISLKKKLGVLAQKVEEYKRDDEYIKGAIIYSQKIRDDALTDAKTKADEYLSTKTSEADDYFTKKTSEADKYIAEKTAEADKLKQEAEEFSTNKMADVESEFEVERREIESKARYERNELALLKNQVCDFRTHLKEVYDKELAAILEIPVYEHQELEVAPEAPEIIEEAIVEEAKEIIEVSIEQITPPDFLNDIASVILEKEQEDKISTNPLEYSDTQKAKTLEEKIDLVLGEDTIASSKGFDFPLKK